MTPLSALLEQSDDLRPRESSGLPFDLNRYPCDTAIPTRSKWPSFRDLDDIGHFLRLSKLATPDVSLSVTSLCLGAHKPTPARTSVHTLHEPWVRDMSSNPFPQLSALLQAEVYRPVSAATYALRSTVPSVLLGLSLLVVLVCLWIRLKSGGFCE